MIANTQVPVENIIFRQVAFIYGKIHFFSLKILTQPLYKHYSVHQAAAEYSLPIPPKISQPQALCMANWPPTLLGPGDVDCQ